MIIHDFVWKFRIFVVFEITLPPPFSQLKRVVILLFHYFGNKTNSKRVPNNFRQFACVIIMFFQKPVFSIFIREISIMFFFKYFPHKNNKQVILVSFNFSQPKCTRWRFTRLLLTDRNSFAKQVVIIYRSPQIM